MTEDYSLYIGLSIGIPLGLLVCVFCCKICISIYKICKKDNSIIINITNNPLSHVTTVKPVVTIEKQECFDEDPV